MELDKNDKLELAAERTMPDMCADCVHWVTDNNEAHENDITASYWDYCNHPKAPDTAEIVNVFENPPEWCPLLKFPKQSNGKLIYK